MLPQASLTENALKSVSWIQLEDFHISPYFVQITLKTQSCVGRLGNMWVCPQWATNGIFSLCCFRDLAKKISFKSAHTEIHIRVHTCSLLQLQQTDTRTHADRHQHPDKQQWDWVLLVMLLALRTSGSRGRCGAKALWCRVGCSEVPCASSSSFSLIFFVVFSSDHPRLCHLRARWRQLDLSGPSAFGNAH